MATEPFSLLTSPFPPVCVVLTQKLPCVGNVSRLGQDHLIMLTSVLAFSLRLVTLSHTYTKLTRKLQPRKNAKHIFFELTIIGLYFMKDILIIKLLRYFALP